jgi:DnaK suppressor protein
MTHKAFLKLRELLIYRHREMLEQVAHLEFERDGLEQHFIESIDSAQKENLAQLIHKLVERGKEEIGEIELALTKMSSGSYGICGLCNKSIPIKRLKVLPATRLCRNCAQKYEEAQTLRKHHRDEIIDDDLLDEYRNLNNENPTVRRLKLPDEQNLWNIEAV